MSRVQSTVRATALLAALLLCTSGPPATPAPEVEVSATSGLGGFARPNCVVPVQVTIVNHGPTIRGTLALTTGAYRSSKVERREWPLTVPAGGKVVRTVLGWRPQDYWYRQTTAVVQSETGSRTAASVPNGASLTEERLAVVVGSRGSLSTVAGRQALSWTQGRFANPQATSGAGGTRVPWEPLTKLQLVAVDPLEAPLDWQAYSAADHVVLPGDVLPRLGEAQRRAVVDWVAAGGWLVVSGGAAPEMGHDPWLGPVLPVTIGGLTTQPRLTALEKRYGSIHPLRDLPLLRPNAIMGTTLLAQEGQPLVVVGRYGLGTVVWLAFDPFSEPFRGWTGAEAFWTEVLRLDHPRQFPVGRAGKQWEQVGTGDTAVRGVRSAALSSVALFLTAYFLLIIPVNRFVLKRLGRTEMAWVTIPALAMLFTFGSYFYARGLKGRQVRLFHQTVVWSGPRAVRSVVADAFAVYSPGLRTYDLRLPLGMRTVVETTGRQVNRDPLGDFVMQPTDPPHLPATRIPMWAARSFAGCRVAEANGRLTAEASLEGDEVVCKVTNNTPHALRGGGLALDDSRWSLGTLMPGETRTERVKLWVKHAPVFGTDRQRRLLAGALPTDPPGRAGLWAFGFSSRVPQRVDTPGYEPDRDELVAYLVVPTWHSESGGVLLTPNECAFVVTKAPTGSGHAYDGGPFYLKAGQTVIELSPPLDRSHAWWERGALRVRVGNEQRPTGLRVEGYDWAAGKWIDLGKQFAPPNAVRPTLSWSVEGLHRFADPKTGKLRFRLGLAGQDQLFSVSLMAVGKETER